MIAPLSNLSRRVLLALAIAPLLLFAVACQTSSRSVSRSDTGAFSERLKVSPAAFDGRSEAFVPHENYLAMSLPFADFKTLFADLQSKVSDRKLVSRGEAHVTIVTPPEFNILKSKVSIAEINDMARKAALQNAKIEPLCIGRGQAKVGGKTESTYFVVVKADILLLLRRQIEQVFLSRGGSVTVSGANSGAQTGKVAGFNADSFKPHVTLGFTKTDLFEEQGVIKDQSSCVYGLDPL